MKIVIDRHIPYIGNVLEQYAEVVYLAGSDITVEHLRHAGALLVRTRTKADATLLDDTAVRFIGTATIGSDHIDMDYCAHRGITVANAAGCNAAGVMQYVTAALLELSTREKRHLNTMTMGIVGVGNVGKLVAKAARALGMHVLLNDPPRAAREGTAGFSEIDALLENADVVTLHVPLAADTRDMANAEFFRKMKKKAWFFNTSRGEVLDEKALIDEREKLAAVVLDVWRHEPEINRSLLAVADIATPHIAGYSMQGKANATRMVVQALAHFCHWTPLFRFEPDVAFCPVNVEWAREDDMHSFIKKIYSIAEDDYCLRRKPDSFESLRMQYRFRNEFCDYHVNTKENSHAAHALRALGCTILP